MAALQQDRGRLSDALDTSRLGALDAETKRLAAEGNSQGLQEELQTLRLKHKAAELEWGALRPLVHACMHAPLRHWQLEACVARDTATPAHMCIATVPHAGVRCP